jgi:hypothetical protein
MDLTAYDQYNNPLPNAAFSFQCDDANLVMCEFRVSPLAIPGTSFTTNENGTLHILFDSPMAGPKNIRIYSPMGPEALAFSVNVAPIIDCSLTSGSVNNSLFMMTIGLDVIEYDVRVRDINNLPVPDVNISFTPLGTGPAAAVVATNSSGIAGLSYNGPIGTFGPPATVQAAFPQCPTFQYMSPPSIWFYGVNCSASNVTIPSTLWTNEALVISGQFIPNDGADLSGAQITVALNQVSPLPITLAPDGTFTWTTPYVPGTFTWPISVFFGGSSLPCSFTGSVFWKDAAPACINLYIDQSTLAFSKTSPLTTDSVIVMVHAANQNGVPLPNSQFTVISNTRASTPDAFSYTGMTDLNGNANFLYTNGNWGTGVDEVTATFGSATSCSVVASVTWVSLPTI